MESMYKKGATNPVLFPAETPVSIRVFQFSFLLLDYTHKFSADPNCTRENNDSPSHKESVYTVKDV